MKKTFIVTIVLMASVGGLLACTESSAKADQVVVQAASPGPGETVAAKPDAVPDTVIVYYFHGTRRCRTCVGIQETISKTIRERFASETASGALTFKEINFEEPEHRHFVNTYNLGFSTMVVSAQKGQASVKWENCNKVWEHAHDPAALAEYTEKNVRAYLALIKGK